jgi:hypothetical protein
MGPEQGDGNSKNADPQDWYPRWWLLLAAPPAAVVATLAVAWVTNLWAFALLIYAVLAFSCAALLSLGIGQHPTLPPLAVIVARILIWASFVLAPIAVAVLVVVFGQRH